MSKDMLGALVRALMTVPNAMFGALIDLCGKLSSPDGGEWFTALKKFLRKEEAWSSPLLRRVTTVYVRGAEKFVARDFLAGANVGFMGPRFEESFLNKVEENVADVSVAVHLLEVPATDVLVMAQLKGRAALKLTHLFRLLKKQSKGEQGILLTNGHAIVVHVASDDGDVLALNVYWRLADRDWSILALPVTAPDEWPAGSQILSRD